MTASKDDAQIARSWLAPLAVIGVHGLAFTMLYITFVFMGPAFAEHYRDVGIASTQRFDAVVTVSSWMAASTFIALIVVMLDAVIVVHFERRSSHWLSPYSHGLMLLVGLITFTGFAWMIHPMVWNRPVAAVAIDEAADPLAVLAGNASD